MNSKIEIKSESLAMPEPIYRNMTEFLNFQDTLNKNGQISCRWY